MMGEESREQLQITFCVIAYNTNFKDHSFVTPNFIIIVESQTFYSLAWLISVLTPIAKKYNKENFVS